MTRVTENKSYCFIGKFTDLIIQLSSIEDKDITLLEFIKNEKKRLKELLN